MPGMSSMPAMQGNPGIPMGGQRYS